GRRAPRRGRPRRPRPPPLLLRRGRSRPGRAHGRIPRRHQTERQRDPPRGREELALRAAGRVVRGGGGCPAPARPSCFRPPPGTRGFRRGFTGSGELRTSVIVRLHLAVPETVKC